MIVETFACHGENLAFKGSMPGHGFEKEKQTPQRASSGITLTKPNNKSPEVGLRNYHFLDLQS